VIPIFDLVNHQYPDYNALMGVRFSDRILKARVDVPAGEQLTIIYQRDFLPLFENWGFLDRLPRYWGVPSLSINQGS
jgi:hypothetical protein